MECWSERRREYLRDYQTTDEYRQWRQQYNDARRETVRAANRVNSKRYYSRQKQKRKALKLRLLMTGVVLK